MLTDLKIEKERNLEYGINQHQIAQLYSAQSPLDYEMLSNTNLNYSDILDLKTGLDITSEFYDVKCSTIIKSGMPCGVALGTDCTEAFQKAIDCDPISAIGGTVVFSGSIDENIAVMFKKMAFNTICATNYNEKALNILLNIDGLNIVKLNTSFENYRKLENYELNATPFGLLVQSQDKKELDINKFKVVSKTKPTSEMIEDAVFAWKIVKHAKSQAVVVVKDFKTLAISQGNTNLVTGVEKAMDYACNDSKDAILATDDEILMTECINAAVQGRVGLIIQTGSSNKNIINAVNKYNLVMLNTGISHIKY